MFWIYTFMNNLPRFREFAEAKDGFADKKVPDKVNQYIPKAGAYPKMDTKQSLAGMDYKGDLGTSGVKNVDKTLPYPTKANDYVNIVADKDNDPKSGFGFKATPGITPQTSSLGKSPDLLARMIKPVAKMKEERPKKTTTETHKMTSEGV